VKSLLEQEVGEVIHYYNKIGVAIVRLSAGLKVGDQIHIQGATSDFAQTVDSMQYEHEDIPEAAAGQEVGLKVLERVREGDKVFVVPLP
jgi:putative protease